MKDIVKPARKKRRISETANGRLYVYTSLSAALKTADPKNAHDRYYCFENRIKVK